MSAAAGPRKKKLLKRKRKESDAASPSAEQLVEQANACLVDLPPQVEQALALFERALKADANSIVLLDAFGALLCEEGDHPRAVELLERSIRLQPDSGYDKYFHLAQITAGAEGLGHYQRGVEVLRKRIEAVKSDKLTLEHTKLASVQASIAEIYMTELCDESDAEDKCEAALKSGFDADPTCLELLVAKMALRKVQGHIDESKELGRACLKHIQEATASADPDAALPSDEVCIALCRALIDLSLMEEARGLLIQLLEQDEEDVQVWYLLACSHLVDGEAAAVKECATRGLEICEQAGGQADDWKQHLSDVLAQAAQLRPGAAKDGQEDEDAEDGS